LSCATIKLFIKEIIKNNRLKIINNIFLLFFIVVKNFKIASNVLRLCEEADFEALNCQPSTNVDTR